MKSQCLISFGSNLGSRDSLISEAARIIADSPLVDCLLTSRLFETPPIGGPSGQEPFLNAVAAFETDGSARQILEMLQSTEQRLGRERKRRWDARSIDLDVVLHGQLVGGGTGLIVPHPRYTARQFVLQPACDVAGHYRDPRFGWTITELTEHLNAAPASIALTGGSEALRHELCKQISETHGILSFASPESLPTELLAIQNTSGTHESSESRREPIDSHAASERSSPANQRAMAAQAAQATKRRTSQPPPSPAREADEAVISSDHRQEPNNPQATVDSGRQILGDTPWVAGFVPLDERLMNRKPSRPAVHATAGLTPRLIGRIQSSASDTPWPAPHQMWPSGWNWPEYRLEIDDKNWAVAELSSAIDSMRCPVKPITEDGRWWV